MVFQRVELLGDMEKIYDVLDSEVQNLIKSVKVGEKTQGEQGGVINEIDNLFGVFSRLIYGEYGKLCKPYEGKEEYIFPYYNKGFVKCKVSAREREFILYNIGGTTFELRQTRTGVRIEKGRYRNIRGIKVVEQNWENWIKEAERYKRDKGELKMGVDHVNIDM